MYSLFLHLYVTCLITLVAILNISKNRSEIAVTFPNTYISNTPLQYVGEMTYTKQQDAEVPIT